MNKKNPTYTELLTRLEQAEATLEALRRGEIDSLLGEAGPLLVQYKAAVDELARLRTEAEQLAQQWQATFDAAGDAIWILDAEQRVVRSNKAAEAVFGCPVAEMAGRHCFDIAHHTDIPIPGCPFGAMCASHQPENFEMQLGKRWYLVTVDPLLDAAGKLTGAVHIVHDITARKEAETALQRRYKELTAVYETSQRLLELLPLEALAQKVVEILEDSLNYTYGAVLLVNEATGQLEPFALSAQGRGPEFVEADKTYVRSRAIVPGKGITGWVAAHGESVRVGDVRQDPRYLAMRENILSELCVPLRLREKVIGVVNIESTEADAYSEDDQRLLENIAAQISVAIQNARLYQQAQQEIEERKQAEAQLRAAHTELRHLLDEVERSRQALLNLVEDLKRAEESLRENNRRLSLLNQLGLALAQTLDLPTIYRTAYESIAQLVDCPLFGISRYDPATQALRAEYMLDEGELLDAARFPPLTFQPDAPITGRARAILTQQPEIVAVMPTPLSGQVTIIGKSDAAHIARAALYVPIIVQGKTTGLLEVQSYRENAYSEADAALLGPVANQIGLAIENARLFAALEAERNSLARRVRERTAALEAANKELEAFSYSVSHDLRAPLRALNGFSQALLSQYGPQLDAQGRHYLERIQASAQRMGDLIDDLLTLSRITRREMTRQPVDLSALAREIAAELQAREPQRQAEFNIADGLTTEGDPHLLRIALENLLGNAWKFTGKREQTFIEFGKIERGRAGDSLSPHTFFVRDNGAGFDMAYAGKLFAPFQRLHGLEEFPGTGIGLATVQRIVARHGGRVWAEAAVEQGATFYFTLGGENDRNL